MRKFIFIVTLANGGYYDNGLGHLYEIEYQGKTEYYIQAGELWDFLTIITNSLNEYTSISERETWVEYRYDGASVAFTADSNYDDHHVSEQSGITCISMYSLNFVSIPQTLQTLGINGELVISDIDGVGCVWSFN